MEKIYRIDENSKLYKDYFTHKKATKLGAEVYNKICDKYGIESDNFLMIPDRLYISPTDNDFIKFKYKFAGNTLHGFCTFKKYTSISKEWVTLVKDIPEFMPLCLPLYIRQLLGCTYKYDFMEIGKYLYIKIDSLDEKVINMQNDFLREVQMNANKC